MLTKFAVLIAFESFARFVHCTNRIVPSGSLSAKFDRFERFVLKKLVIDVSSCHFEGTLYQKCRCLVCLPRTAHNNTYSGNEKKQLLRGGETADTFASDCVLEVGLEPTQPSLAKGF